MQSLQQTTNCPPSCSLSVWYMKKLCYDSLIRNHCFQKVVHAKRFVFMCMILGQNEPVPIARCIMMCPKKTLN
jgi:hypothetical protein